MASIPLPALAINQEHTSPIDTYVKAMQLRHMQQQQQLMPGQMEAQKLENTAHAQENEQRSLQLKDMQTLRDLGPKYVQKDESGNVTGFDFNGLANEATGKGVNPATVQALQLQHSQTVKSLAEADAATRGNELAKNKASYEALESVRSVSDPAQREAAYQSAIPNLQKLGINTSQFPKQVPDDATLKSFEAGLGMHAQMLSDAKTVAETNQSNEKANLDKMEAAQKGSPLTAMETNPAAMAGDKLPAAMAYLTSKMSDPATPPEDKARATRLLSTAKIAQQTQLSMERSKKEMDQSIQDGDPAAAARLLVSSVVAPSQLVSSRKPEFAQKAFTAAQQLKPGWNAEKADADFKVASSPAQVAFFGSAKSLTDSGGTLDQLKAAGDDIPQGQFPVFNTVADALKASTGSGPIAKYAAIALGVADDYSKVMGGGAGSDTSRTQALNLISSKQSPSQRAASIEGIRGSVGSQTKSRIGNNAVLQQMYGAEGPQGGGPAASKAEPPAGNIVVTAPDGSIHPFDTQAQANEFKRLAKIK